MVSPKTHPVNMHPEKLSHPCLMHDFSFSPFNDNATGLALCEPCLIRLFVTFSDGFYMFFIIHTTFRNQQIAKKTVITNIQSISDYPNSYINFYYNLLISEGRVDEEKHIEAIRNVTKESIVNALAHMLDTVACLVKEENHA